MLPTSLDTTVLRALVIDIIASTLCVSRDLVRLSSNLSSDLNADSLDLVAVLREIESAFDIEVDNRRIENIETVADVVGITAEYVAAKAELEKVLGNG